MYSSPAECVLVGRRCSRTLFTPESDRHRNVNQSECKRGRLLKIVSPDDFIQTRLLTSQRHTSTFDVNDIYLDDSTADVKSRHSVKTSSRRHDVTSSSCHDVVTSFRRDVMLSQQRAPLRHLDNVDVSPAKRFVVRVDAFKCGEVKEEWDALEEEGDWRCFSPVTPTSPSTRMKVDQAIHRTVSCHFRQIFAENEAMGSESEEEEWEEEVQSKWNREIVEAEGLSVSTSMVGELSWRNIPDGISEASDEAMCQINNETRQPRCQTNGRCEPTTEHWSTSRHNPSVAVKSHGLCDRDLQSRDKPEVVYSERRRSPDGQEASPSAMFEFFLASSLPSSSRYISRQRTVELGTGSSRRHSNAIRSSSSCRLLGSERMTSLRRSKTDVEDRDVSRVRRALQSVNVNASCSLRLCHDFSAVHRSVSNHDDSQRFRTLAFL